MSKLSWFALIVITAAVLVVGVIFGFDHKNVTKAAAPESKPLPAGWTAAPPQFLEAWDAYQAVAEDAQKNLKALQDSPAVKKFQKENDEAVGMAQRILVNCTPTVSVVCIPPGFQFDVKQRAFSPAPPQSPSADTIPIPAKGATSAK